ncbi:rod-binding protein [Nitrospirillum pindoramense]|uniref:Rod binding domain-containing protein n=1 Tax=Nitrospirillum amazonense TaxID=28077 RepID=A0A560HDY3_9PROT|nr:rod-binding protein [Nitrospirillum amazonense]TWB44251.1 Rod binding domain-containing protein [Nitrospirillum amazonense]
MSDEMRLSPPGYDAKALMDAKGTPRPQGGPGDGTKDDAAVEKAAKEFESVFISQMLQHMWEGVEVDPNFGGGHAEEMFRGMMIEEQAKAITKGGGLGIADEIKKEMVRMQEKAGATDPLRRPRNAYAQAQASLAQHMPLDTATDAPAATGTASDDTP